MNKEDLIDSLAKLLNGQIRGPINAKGKEENLGLIQMTMGRLYDDAYEQGSKDKEIELQENQIKKDIIDGIKKEIEQ